MYACLAIGFKFEMSEFDVFKRTTPAVYETKKRFDQNTGERLADVREVVTPAQTFYLVEEDYGPDYSLNEALGSITCVINMPVDKWTNSTGVFIGYVFRESEAMYNSHPVNVSSIIKMNGKVNKLKKSLSKLGLDMKNKSAIVFDAYDDEY
jgi:hypothetical protein